MPFELEAALRKQFLDPRTGKIDYTIQEMIEVLSSVSAYTVCSAAHNEEELAALTEMFTMRFRQQLVDYDPRIE